MPIGAGIPIIGPAGPAIGPTGAPGIIPGGPPSKLPCGFAPGGRWPGGMTPEIHILQKQCHGNKVSDKTMQIKLQTKQEAQLLLW